ncbi:alpha/beta fold hydrolase [Oscillatoria sp. FACHB-1406]|uniref:alpha/beta fold hydrolase n=1 Tax=Oscillatoria sp. FACHB-1406 TaxID=2692846 RepID=UPI001685719B|nr:alpha/beta fold hydrolase [Oscillatoria sp. FACHB-1406]MBD2579491.1 alpha/beta fold hydrolase [Oscillatoria sp. FACHB-1406]
MSETPKCFVWKDFELQCGVVLQEAKLVYQTYGELNRNRSNVILYPTSYGAQHFETQWLIGKERILDPSRWFIIIPNLFGNGLSSSPSNCKGCGLAQQGFYFTHLDNVRAQEKLLRESFGIERLALVYGWSMGAQQAYHWGALYRDRVDRIAAICGTARVTVHNQIFLKSLRAALTADPAWNGERFTATPERGFHTFALIYASWAASQAFYRHNLHQQGERTLDEYLSQAWEANYRKRDPHNLIAMLDTWLRCDISDNPLYRGDFQKALASIRAKTLVMPSRTDLYFTPEDCQAEAASIPDAIYRPIESIWGHRAGNPYQNLEDERFIRDAVRELLSVNSERSEI